MTYQTAEPMEIEGVRYFREVDVANLLHLKTSTWRNSMSLLYRENLIHYLERCRSRIVPADEVGRLMQRLENKLKLSSASELAAKGKLNGRLVIFLLERS